MSLKTSAVAIMKHLGRLSPHLISYPCIWTVLPLLFCYMYSLIGNYGMKVCCRRTTLMQFVMTAVHCMQVANISLHYSVGVVGGGWCQPQELVTEWRDNRRMGKGRDKHTRPVIQWPQWCRLSTSNVGRMQQLVDEDLLEWRDQRMREGGNR